MLASHMSAFVSISPALRCPLNGLMTAGLTPGACAVSNSSEQLQCLSICCAGAPSVLSPATVYGCKLGLLFAPRSRSPIPDQLRGSGRSPSPSMHMPCSV